MKRGFRVPILMLCMAAPVAAQEQSSFVTPRGVLGLGLAGEVTQFDSRFGSTGNAGGSERVPLGSLFTGPVTAERFGPLVPLQAELNRFFTRQTDGAERPGLVASAENLLLGNLRFEATAEMTRAPLSLSAGVLPRVSVEVVVPFVQLGRAVSAFALADGTVGTNPDVAFNRTLLGRVGAGFTELGELGFLPVAGSALGVELQRRVAAAANGDTLRLPTAPLTTAQFASLLAQPQFGLAVFNPAFDNWRVGDVEVGLRIQLLNTLAEGAYPRLDSSAVRVAAEVYGRLPTGQRPDSLPLPSLDPGLGQTGVTAGLAADWFRGRLHAAAHARYTALLTGTVVQRVGGPFAPTTEVRSLERNPGDELEIRLAPRYRLNPFLALGLEYSFWSKTEDGFIDGNEDVSGLVGVGSRSAHRAGVGARFTTLPSYYAGGSVVPIEISLGYSRTFAGTGGAPAAGTLQVRGRVYQRAWGRNRTRAGEP